MPHKKRSAVRLFASLLFAFICVAATLHVLAQEPAPQIFITGDNVTSPPGVEVYVYGRDPEGQAVDFSQQPLLVTHDGAVVNATVEGTIPEGTLTVFLVDTASGVTDQIPNIQNAIKQFASPSGGMQEQVDTMAVYLVGESEAEQLLPPTMFYNSIQNFFVNDLQPVTGTTALVDSLVSLLDQVESLKPSPDTVTFIVVMSDGTDVVSTFEPAEIFTRTAELDIPINTIWVNSTDLTLAGQQQGQAFLQDISDATQGLATTLDEPSGVSAVWNRIAGFRDRARVRYVVEELTGGNYEVDVSLGNDPAIHTTAIVVVPENQPQVEILIPLESREWSLPNLEEPVRIKLSTLVSWLDGDERAISSARLRINNVDVADIPVEEIEEFTADVTNFVYGSNNLEIAIEDEQGLKATNLPLEITIIEGDRSLPAEVRPSSGIGQILFYGLLILLVLLVIGGVIYWFMRRKGAGGLPRGRSRRSRQSTTVVQTGAGSEEAVVGAAAPAAGTGRPYVMAHLEVLEATTLMDEKLNLEGATIRIGRSPTQAEIAFREDITMSRLHASLMLEGDHYRIFDEKSTSGTWVNGRQVPEYGLQLMDGDEITMGAVHLRFRQL